VNGVYKNFADNGKLEKKWEEEEKFVPFQVLALQRDPTHYKDLETYLTNIQTVRHFNNYFSNIPNGLLALSRKTEISLPWAKSLQMD
jgi:hypothetical protein